LKLNQELADELLRVHRSYLKPLRALIGAGLLKGAAHITGGGLTDNIPRVLPAGTGAEIRIGSWPVLPIFERLRAIGNLGSADYRRTFNLGIGMVVVVSKRNLSKAWALLDRMGERSFDIGLVVKSRQRRVKYVG
jgi:phosphoribosylformylglycinamidine cyclo-ligase